MKNRLCLIFLFFMAQLAIGQKGPPMPKPNSPPGLPIDSGIVWLFVLGCVIGIIEYNRKSIKQ